jgi:hypothetical protein
LRIGDKYVAGRIYGEVPECVTQLGRSCLSSITGVTRGTTGPRERSDIPERLGAERRSASEQLKQQWKEGQTGYQAAVMRRLRTPDSRHRGIFRRCRYKRYAYVLHLAARGQRIPHVVVEIALVIEGFLFYRAVRNRN